jgi:hypothetical protein
MLTTELARVVVSQESDNRFAIQCASLHNYNPNANASSAINWRVYEYAPIADVITSQQSLHTHTI